MTFKGDGMRQVDAEQVSDDQELQRIAVPFTVQGKLRTSTGNVWKYELQTPKGGRIETASFIRPIPEGMRHDISISTMVGCPLSCGYCACAESFSDYLTADQIVAQAQQAIEDRRADGLRPVRTIVGTMGDGEPMLNQNNLLLALDALLSDPTLDIHHCRISTTGIRPQNISQLADQRCAAGGRVRLQFSLVAVDPATRKKVIKVGGDSLDACVPHLDYFAERTGRQTLYNVPLIGGLNDSKEDAHALADFLEARPTHRKAKISHCNGIPGSEYESSTPLARARFIAILKRRKVPFKIFEEVPADEVMAACGQMHVRPEMVRMLTQIDGLTDGSPDR